MYNIPEYKAKDAASVTDFMKQHPFAMLIAVDANNTPVATQVPFLLKEREGVLCLHAHIMKHTDHHKALLQNNKVLVVFTGAHSYISASWYTNPQQASTWNYQAVHAKGELQFLDTPQLLQMLAELTNHFEAPNSPAAYQHIPQSYIDKLVNTIVAFEIKVAHIDHVFKLSQGKDTATHASIIQHLETGDADAKQVAEEMKKEG